MDETKIEQVEAQAEEVKAEETVETPEVEAQEVAEDAVTEECSCSKGDANQAKKEPEDDQSEKKVAVKKEAEEAKQTEGQTEKTDVLESLKNSASEKVADIVMEALASLPIEEGMSEEDVNARKEQIMENGSKLLADVFDVLEEIVNGTTVELNGHQVEVKDFVVLVEKLAWDCLLELILHVNLKMMNQKRKSKFNNTMKVLKKLITKLNMLNQKLLWMN